MGHPGGKAGPIVNGCAPVLPQEPPDAPQSAVRRGFAKQRGRLRMVQCESAGNFQKERKAGQNVRQIKSPGQKMTGYAVFSKKSCRI
jgi:hypothetical protein